MRHGRLTKVCRRRNKVYEFFLFSDRLVYADRTYRGRLKANRVLTIDDAFEVEELAPQILTHGLRIVSREKSVSVFCSSKAQQHLWFRALEACGVMPYIKKFAGASAGALVAALLAAGLTADELFIELATTDLKPMILDSSTSLHQVRDIYSRYGMNPGNGLYQHIGYLFYKYLGSADVTFRELYEMYGVELAVSTANVSRAAVEMLHVKTAPDYPIRKAVRASMSLPVALHPCRDKNIHSVISEGVSS